MLPPQYTGFIDLGLNEGEENFHETVTSTKVPSSACRLYTSHHLLLGMRKKVIVALCVAQGPNTYWRGLEEVRLIAVLYKEALFLEPASSNLLLHASSIINH